MRFVLEKRKRTSRTVAVLVPIVSFFFSLLLAAVLLVISRASPIATYTAMFKGAFGT